MCCGSRRSWWSSVAFHEPPGRRSAGILCLSGRTVAGVRLSTLVQQLAVKLGKASSSIKGTLTVDRVELT